MKDKNAWDSYDKEELAKLEKLCKAYREFLDAGKTERECVKEIVKQVKKAGYEDIQDVIKEGRKLTKGSKVYAVWMNKTVALFNIGKKNIEKGMNILGAHIDSPRMDIKQIPLYEKEGLLWWNQEVSVGNFTTCYPWCSCQDRRRGCRGKHWGRQE